MLVTVTPAQAKLLADACAARDAAIQTANDVLTILSAGHVPAGAELTALDVDTGTLTFHVKDDAG